MKNLIVDIVIIKVVIKQESFLMLTAKSEFANF